MNVRVRLDDTLMDLPEGDHITRAIQSTGRFYEQDLLDAIQSLEPRDVAVDVGAHRGNHALFFADLPGIERVIAVEPDLGNFHGLRANVALNRLESTVTPVFAAVTAQLSWVETVQGEPGNTGMARAEEANPTVPEGTVGMPLDLLLRQHAFTDRVGLLKIDVEGDAVEALRSGMVSVTRDLPVVAIEASESTAGAILEPFGYVLHGTYCSTPTTLWKPA